MFLSRLPPAIANVASGRLPDGILGKKFMHASIDAVSDFPHVNACRPGRGHIGTFPDMMLAKLRRARSCSTVSRDFSHDIHDVLLFTMHKSCARIVQCASRRSRLEAARHVPSGYVKGVHADVRFSPLADIQLAPTTAFGGKQTSQLAGRMSAYGTKPTSACALHMSAFDPKRTWCRPVFAFLGPADAGIVEGCDNLPTAALGHLCEPGNLIFDGLLVGRNADIKRRPFAWCAESIIIISHI